MAAALINALGKGRYIAKSAGSKPTGYVHPKALQTLRRHGIEPDNPQSQSWDAYTDEAFDFLITVCDSAAAESCPAFPGKLTRLHWSTPDPAKCVGGEAKIDAAFERTFELLTARIKKELL